MYRSAFPSSLAESDASASDSIKLDDSNTFKLKSNGERETTVVTGVSGGTGEVISILNSSLEP